MVGLSALLPVLACAYIQVAGAFITPVSSVSYTIPPLVQPRQGHSFKLRADSNLAEELSQVSHSWSPQDLTEDQPGFPPIPKDDYINLYQENAGDLWPVEFFLVAYRLRRSQKGGTTTQVLVRKSANGTAKWGLGTGVPATRWVLSAASGGPEEPPKGYEYVAPSARSQDSTASQSSTSTISTLPLVEFEARHFPEFHQGNKDTHSWTYSKVRIRKDAFSSRDLEDSQLESYAEEVWEHLKNKISQDLRVLRSSNERNDWDFSRLKVVLKTVEHPSCVAAIQGTLRMSGLFTKRRGREDIDSPLQRYIDLERSKTSSSPPPDPANLVQSMRIYTMFPQMPNPMPLPTTSAQELQEELASRPARMKEARRNPHSDVLGRVYTHISTSNVSNTIHGIYFSLDVTDYSFLGEEDDDDDDCCGIPALNMFETTTNVQREWKSLQELKVLDKDEEISVTDPKSTFISGFIVRQLVKEGVIPGSSEYE